MAKDTQDEQTSYRRVLNRIFRGNCRIKESEKDTEPYLVQRMAEIGGLARKFISPNHRGVPDQICCFPNGLTIFVEVKSEGKEPPGYQLREHSRLRACRQLVEVVSTKAEVNGVIEKYNLAVNTEY